MTFCLLCLVTNNTKKNSKKNIDIETSDVILFCTCESISFRLIYVFIRNLIVIITLRLSKSELVKSMPHTHTHQ